MTAQEVESLSRAKVLLSILLLIFQHIIISANSNTLCSLIKVSTLAVRDSSPKPFIIHNNHTHGLPEQTQPFPKPPRAQPSSNLLTLATLRGPGTYRPKRDNRRVAFCEPRSFSRARIASQLNRIASWSWFNRFSATSRLDGFSTPPWFYGGQAPSIG